MQLSKNSIITASLSILSNFGLADMTMRRVATQLNVAPGALYWHFKNKQALIDATAREILSDFLLSSPPSLDAACSSLRTAMLSIRDGAELISAALIDPHLREEVTGILSASLGEEAPRMSAATALHFVMGATVLEQSEIQQHKTVGMEEEFLAGLALITTGIKHSRN